MPNTATRAELVSRASKIAPVLQSHAMWTEENRRLHDESIEALADAGVFRLRVPARYGGYESDAGTLVEVLSQVGAGDGSAAWNSAVWAICAWLTCLLPDGVQDEVFSAPDVRVCGVLSPTAQAAPRSGGLVVNGAWHFISGALHSQWQVILAMAPTPDGAGQWPVMAVVPMPDLEIVDDWHTAGLRGTGSVTTLARDTFVPQERVLPMVAILQEQYASQQNANTPIYRSPMIPTGCTSFTGPAIGLAKVALSAFLELLPGRNITYTDYSSQREAPLTHHQVANAALWTDEAEFHATRLASLVDEKCANGAKWTPQERGQARADLGRTFQLAKAAAGILSTASGGSSIYLNVPIQRIERDINTLNQHSLMHPDTCLELYGRLLCGLGPNTTYF